MIIKFDTYNSVQINTDKPEYLTISDSIGDYYLVQRKDILEFNVLWNYNITKNFMGEEHIEHAISITFEVYNKEVELVVNENVLQPRKTQNSQKTLIAKSDDKEFIQRASDEIEAWINTKEPDKIEIPNENSVGKIDMSFSCGQVNYKISINNSEYFTVVERTGAYNIKREKLLDVSVRSIQGNPIKRNIRYGVRVGKGYVGTTNSYYEKGKTLYILDLEYIDEHNKLKHISIYNPNKIQADFRCNIIKKWKCYGYDTNKKSNIDNEGCVGILVLFIIIIVISVMFSNC